MKIKPIISALPVLTPVSIVETKTGLILSLDEHDSIMTRLITFVQTSAIKCYKENKSQLEKNILDSKRVLVPQNSQGRMVTRWTQITFPKKLRLSLEWKGYFGTS